MSLHLSRRLDTLVPGERFVADAGHARPLLPGETGATLKVMTVVSVSRESVDAVDARGGSVAFRRRDAHSPWRSDGGLGPAWTDPLPTGDEAATLAYVGAVLAARTSPLVLLVGDAVTGGHEARVVVEATCADVHDSFPEGDRHAGYDRAGGYAAWREPVLIRGEDLAPGDLVVAPAFRCVVEGGVAWTVAERGVTVGRFGDVASVAAFLPDPSPGLWSPLAGPAEHAHEASRAHAGTEPDEALFLWVREADGKGTSCVSLATSGIVFHDVDGLADYFYGAGIEPGLWVLEGAAWWVDNGSPANDWERDSGIDGTWRPATREDLERFGVDDSEVEEAVADATDGAPRAGATEEYLSLASPPSPAPA